MPRSRAAAAQSPGTFSGFKWTSLGPRPAIIDFPAYNFHFGAVSGRVDALAVSPANSSVLLLGAATGGIWKSTDSGTSWRPVSDAAPALAISSISWSPANPSLVFAGTGEADSQDLEFRPSTSLGTYLGAGVLRSTDAGDTWARVDVNLPANSIVARVLAHATDAQRVIAGLSIVQNIAANRVSPGGIYLSTDGGAHFAKTFTHVVSDLAADPSGADGVFAAFGVTGGCSSSCSSPSGVYRSTDFGATWTPSFVSTTPGATFSNPTGGIKLAITPSEIEASVLDTGDSYAGGGIYRSTDGGGTWSQRATPPGMCPPGGNQCSYDHLFAPVPGMAGTLFAGDIDLYRSTDGAGTWTQLTDVYFTGGTLHPDQHTALSVNGTLFIGNDGGLFRTTDSGATFQSLNATLTLAEFNSVGLHPKLASFAMGGTQDNGNLRFTNSLTWTDRTGGDGGFSLVEETNPNVLLSGYVYADTNFSSDGGQSFSYSAPSPLMSSDFSPREPMQFYPPVAVAPGSPGTVFLGAERVWANTGFGQSGGVWAPRAGTVGVRSAIKANWKITALEVTGDGTGAVWTGLVCSGYGGFACPSTPTGTLSFSTDGGATWTERNTGLPANVPTRIASASADGTSAYATFGGYGAGHVFETTDSGATWQDLSANLPDVPVLSFAIDPGDASDLFAGTDVGVFRSTDAGVSWAAFDLGLPQVGIYDLRFHPVTRDLFAATYGRGMFRSSPLGAHGDVNGDGDVNVADVFYLINYLFASGPAPFGSADANGDHTVDVGDVFFLINTLFAGGPWPV